MGKMLNEDSGKKMKKGEEKRKKSHKNAVKCLRIVCFSVKNPAMPVASMYAAPGEKIYLVVRGRGWERIESNFFS